MKILIIAAADIHVQQSKSFKGFKKQIKNLLYAGLHVICVAF